MSFKSNNDPIRTKHVLLMNKEFNNEKLSRLIEQQLYNKCIRVSKERFIKRKWSNPLFKNLYISKIRSFYTNISTNSYVNNVNFKKKIMMVILK